MNALTVTIPTFCEMVGLKRTSAYALITAGEVESFRLRGRRLITVCSIQALIDRRLAAAKAGETR